MWKYLTKYANVGYFFHFSNMLSILEDQNYVFDIQTKDVYIFQPHLNFYTYYEHNISTIYMKLSGKSFQ